MTHVQLHQLLIILLEFNGSFAIFSLSLALLQARLALCQDALWWGHMGTFHVRRRGVSN